MEALNAIIGPRESEFTGLKGQVLRYVGAAFFLTVFALLVEAAGNRHELIAAATDPLSDLLFACAVSLYPGVTCWRHLAKMTAAYRSGEPFELAGAVLAHYGRDEAERVQTERAAVLERDELVAAMRAEGTDEVIARFGRDGAYSICRNLYVATIAVFAAAFIFMIVVRPF